jgi:tRNA A37 threonylcarbamoyltransferase TsaD
LGLVCRLEQAAEGRLLSGSLNNPAMVINSKVAHSLHHRVKSNADEYPLLAQSGHHDAISQCPLLGVKRTSAETASMSAFDPKRTFGPGDCYHAK